MSAGIRDSLGRGASLQGLRYPAPGGRGAAAQQELDGPAPPRQGHQAVAGSAWEDRGPHRRADRHRLLRQPSDV
jgi:hypothetical protein